MQRRINTLFGTTLLAAATFASAEPVSYTIDASHTSVVSESRHFGTSTIRTRFAAKNGTVTIDTAAKTGMADITIDMTSTLTGIVELDAKLKSISMFDAPGYPEASFVSKAFTFTGDKVAAISGDLTMHGKTNPVTLKSTNFNCYASPLLKKQVCGGDFETTVQRSLWDVKYLIPLVSDDTRLLIQVEAVKD